MHDLTVADVNSALPTAVPKTYSFLQYHYQWPFSSTLKHDIVGKAFHSTAKPVLCLIACWD